MDKVDFKELKYYVLIFSISFHHKKIGHITPLQTTVAPSGIGNARMPNNGQTFEIWVFEKNPLELSIRRTTFAFRPIFQIF